MNLTNVKPTCNIIINAQFTVKRISTVYYTSSECMGINMYATIIILDILMGNISQSYMQCPLQPMDDFFEPSSLQSSGVSTLHCQ